MLLIKRAKTILNIVFTMIIIVATILNIVLTKIGTISKRLHPRNFPHPTHPFMS